MTSEESLLSAIRQAFAAGRYFVSHHATLEAIEDDVDLVLLEAALQSDFSELLEDYPADPRGPSCLILTWLDYMPLHVVCSHPPTVVIITVYRPDPARWLDFRTRR